MDHYYGEHDASPEQLGEGESVLQEWVSQISFKKQTVMLGAIRAPDNLHTLQLKKVVIWIRAAVLKNADPMTGFMHGALKELPLFEQIDRDFERLTVHGAHHILLAMQVISRHHPDPEVRTNAWKFYSDAVDAQHLNPETWQQFEARYTDNRQRIEEGTS